MRREVPEARVFFLSLPILGRGGLVDLPTLPDDGTGTVCVVDESGTRTKGTQTPGVQRQHGGERGKVENCVPDARLRVPAPGCQAPLTSGEGVERAVSPRRPGRGRAPPPSGARPRPFPGPASLTHPPATSFSDLLKPVTKGPRFPVARVGPQRLPQAGQRGATVSPAEVNQGPV